MLVVSECEFGHYEGGPVANGDCWIQGLCSQATWELFKKQQLLTNDGVSVLKPFDINETYCESTLYWLVRETARPSVYIRLRAVGSKFSYVLIDNSRISLMVDNQMNRLTEYPSRDFNITVDRLLERANSLDNVFDFMLNEELMVREQFQCLGQMGWWFFASRSSVIGQMEGVLMDNNKIKHVV